MRRIYKYSLVILFILLLISISGADTVNINVVDETYSLNIPSDVKSVLKDYYRNPVIQRDDLIKVDGWNTVNVIMHYDRWNGSDWIDTSREFNLWKDYEVESRYCIEESSLVENFCIQYGQYTYEELAKQRIKQKVKIWVMKEYNRITSQRENVEIGEKTISI